MKTEDKKHLNVPTWDLAAVFELRKNGLPDHFFFFVPEEATVAWDACGEADAPEIRLDGALLHTKTRCMVCGRNVWGIDGTRGQPPLTHSECRHAKWAWDQFSNAFMDMADRGLYGDESAPPISNRMREVWRKRLWTLANSLNVESGEKAKVPNV